MQIAAFNSLDPMLGASLPPGWRPGVKYVAKEWEPLRLPAHSLPAPEADKRPLHSSKGWSPPEGKDKSVPIQVNLSTLVYEADNRKYLVVAGKVSSAGAMVDTLESSGGKRSGYYQKSVTITLHPQIPDQADAVIPKEKGTFPRNSSRLKTAIEMGSTTSTIGSVTGSSGFMFDPIPGPTVTVGGDPGSAQAKDLTPEGYLELLYKRNGAELMWKVDLVRFKDGTLFRKGNAKRRDGKLRDVPTCATQDLPVIIQGTWQLPSGFSEPLLLEMGVQQELQYSALVRTQILLKTVKTSEYTVAHFRTYRTLTGLTSDTARVCFEDELPFSFHAREGQVLKERAEDSLIQPTVTQLHPPPSPALPPPTQVASDNLNSDIEDVLAPLRNAAMQCLSRTAFLAVFCLDLDDLFVRCARSSPREPYPSPRFKPSEWPLLVEGLRPALQDLREKILALEGPAAWEKLADALRRTVDGDAGMWGVLKVGERLPWAAQFVQKCSVKAGQPDDFRAIHETLCAAEREAGVGGEEFWVAIGERAWGETLKAALVASEALIAALEIFGAAELAGSSEYTKLSPAGGSQAPSAVSSSSNQPKRLGPSWDESSGDLGSSPPDNTDPATALAANTKQHVKRQTIRVLYATERERVPRDADPDGIGYANRRRAVGYGPFECGWVHVTIPEQWIESGMEVVCEEIMRVQPIPMAPETPTVSYQEAVGREILEFMRNVSRKEALVFVHGFANSFAKAVQRAAGLSAGLCFGGLTVAWDWPAWGDVPGYIADGLEIVPSCKNLAAQYLGAQDEDGCGLLWMLTKANNWAGERCLVRTVHLVAHSMGNRVVFDGLASHVYLWRADRDKIGQVIAVAADTPLRAVEEGVRALVGGGAPVSLRVTRYLSASDLPLRLSAALQFGRNSGAGLETLGSGNDNFDSIDARMSFGHSYLFSSRRVRADIHFVLDGRPPSSPYRYGVTIVQHTRERAPRLFELVPAA